MVQPANKRLVTEASLAVAIDAEADLARNADNLDSGTVDIARIPSTIARVVDVDADIAAEAALARDASNLNTGTIPDARIPASITRDTELLAEAALARDASNLNTGTIPDARIPPAITRDSELATAIADAIVATITNGDTTHAPNADVVYDALALKAPTNSPTFTGTVDADGATEVLVPTAASGANNNKAASTAFVQDALSVAAAAIPPGVIAPYAGGALAVPVGWFVCDGQEVSRTTYAALFGILGTQFGAGNGTSTFNLPNLKGRVPVGMDSGQTEFDTRGETGGEKTHVLTSAEMPAHSHQLTGSVRRTPPPDTGSDPIVVSSINTLGSSSGATADSGNTDNSTGGGGAHNNLQPYMVLHYIIKT